MKFWKFSTNILATLLAVVSVNASGPSSGEAAADPNSAVVKLTIENFRDYLNENPIVLAEFFAPWCGYCKMLGPEYSKAANLLNETNPNIKLVQVDCVEEELLCSQQGIRGYPTLKIYREGQMETIQDYEGPREAEGMVDYMIQQSLPSVRSFETFDLLMETLDQQTKPFVILINPENDSQLNVTYEQVAKYKRKDHLFVTISDKDQIKKLNRQVNAKLSDKSVTILVIHPGAYDDVNVLAYDNLEEITKNFLTEFVSTAAIPYFGDINRDTYMRYMESPLPLAYYFYNTEEERAAVADKFAALGKLYKGRINFVGLDASQFAKHAEMINMNPDIIPLFAIQDVVNNKKYGIDQIENPNGPTFEQIQQFVSDYVAGDLSPNIKSEKLPNEEEIAENPVRKLVAHNHQEILSDVSKDIFVKYYAPWCGHCISLAPIWEELAGIYDSNKPDAKVVVADLDFTNNDVTIPFTIEGYPTIVLYPANGEIDEQTGLRIPVFYKGPRELEPLIDFIKENGSLGIDGRELQEAKGVVEEGITEEDDEVAEESAKNDDAEEVEEEDVDHDEL
ncbi:thioredoxin-like protein [Scheffersomyces amazonensis]|uniref:thioredoxin-like protein n=1 Tax=Scheffersomyces amazonensis TaxID=1078765 RepID=UPI00315D02A0